MSRRFCCGLPAATVLIALALAFAGTAATATDGTALIAAGARRAAALQASGAYASATGGDLIDVPVAIHVVRRSDGSEGLGETTIAAAMADADAAFAGAGMLFCRAGPTRYIDSDAFYLEIDTAAEVDALRATDRVGGAINVYFTEQLATEAGELCSVSSFSFDPVQGIVMANACMMIGAGDSSFVHALGHYFDLFDTDETAFGVECVNGTNCAIAGDLVCDTAAASDLAAQMSGCVYIGNELGPCPGDGLYHPDTTNYMADVPPACRTHFTPGQHARALSTLVNVRPELTGGCSALAARYYVSASAAPGGDGLDWSTAFADLQDALDAAAAAAGELVDVWIAAGTYTPDRGTGDRDLSFDVPSGARLLGGFAGFERGLEERDIEVNETILSGDLLGNDAAGTGLVHPSLVDNSFHVVTAQETNESATLDGLTITGGVAFGAPVPRSMGGGAYVSDGVLTIRLCRFIENRAIDGGAIAASFTGEFDVSQTDFLHNRIFNRGGALFHEGFSQVTTDSFDRCRFIGNITIDGLGGAVYGSGLFRSSLFAGNTAHLGGGGILVRSATVVESCTFFANFSDNGGAGIDRNDGTVTAADSIFWSNSNSNGVSQGSQIAGVSLDHCCIHQLGNAAGPGLIGDDPLFADPLGPDGEPGTLDDDLRLLQSSPCINRGRPGVAASGALDLDGLQRLQFCRIDIGAHEWPLVARDCNGNGADDECDLVEGVSDDCDGNGIPDECDIAGGSAFDCNGNGVPDGCEIATGASADCNTNGMPDECDVLGASSDCNDNGTPDECELATSFAAASPQLGPIVFQSPQQFFVPIAPAAAGPVVLDFEAVSELSGSARRIDIWIDGTLVGDVFMFGTNCASPNPDTDQLVLDPAVFNAAAGADGFTIDMVPRSSVDGFCNGSFISVAVGYPIEPVADDVNGSGVPDECECLGDCAQPPDGAVDVDDLLAVIIAWGTPGGACDANGDGTVDVIDLVVVITGWGPCAH